MKEDEKMILFLVDDDALYLKSLEIEFLQDEQYIIKTFPTGESCIEHLSEKPQIIILDYLLDGINVGAMNGIKTLDKIKEYDPNIAVIMLSAQDKIEVAVNCMHHKAFDYIVKSETAYIRLQSAITAIIKYKRLEKEVGWYMDRMRYM